MFSTKFIKATEEYCTYQKSINAPLLRKTFDLGENCQKAGITLTSTGFYRVWFNGKEITKSRLAPYITNPDEIIFYDTYDLSDLAVKGKNCIAFMLGNGISNCMGGHVWKFDTALFRSSPKLALCFEGVSDGKEITFEADETFKTAPSPIYFDDLRSGEFYDANLEIENWNKTNFDDSTGQNALKTDPARGKAVLNDTDSVVAIKELKAEKIIDGYVVPFVQENPSMFDIPTFYKPEKDEKGYVFAFSENNACVPKLKINGKKGQKIVIQCAEFCDENGGISFENIQGYYPFGFCQRDIYICKGEKNEEYIPSFTYHGARYFLVMGIEKEQLRDDTVTMLVMNSDLAERGNFSCSDDVANRLQRNTRISDLANFVYFPTDCPHREKNGWTGDIAMSCEHFFQNLAVEKSLKQWLMMMCRTQREDGAFPGIVPTSGWGYAWGNGHGPTWDSAIVEVPYMAYIYRGDTEIFKMCSDSVMRYLNFLTKHRNPDGTVKLGLGDWCHALRMGHNHLCPTEVSDTIMCINICRKAAVMFEKIGLNIQSGFAKALEKELMYSARENLIDFDTMTVKGACQTSQAMALYYDVFEKGERAQGYKRLLEFIHEKEDRFDCGMIGVRIMFRLLADNGDADLAYKMITRTDAPSYGIWTEKFGLASLAESFQTEVNGHATSLNHHFMGDISGFFISRIAGLQINPYKNDASYVKIAPNFIEKLHNAEAFYETVSGRVSVRWERKEDLIEMKVSVAEGIKGEIVLPKGYVFVHADSLSDDFTHDRKFLVLSGDTYLIKKI